MHDDVEITLILGQSFLATSKALINVSDGMMVLRVGGKEVVSK